jgi:hypothetical protein
VLRPILVAALAFSSAIAGGCRAEGGASSEGDATAAFREAGPDAVHDLDAYATIEVAAPDGDLLACGESLNFACTAPSDARIHCVRTWSAAETDEALCSNAFTATTATCGPYQTLKTAYVDDGFVYYYESGALVAILYYVSTGGLTWTCDGSGEPLPGAFWAPAPDGGGCGPSLPLSICLDAGASGDASEASASADASKAG